jgi:carbamoyl-phosphate synthase small subunit
MESSQVYPAGLVIRDLALLPSSWRANESLPEFLERGRVVAIAGLDTRKLTRILREKGAQSGCIMTGEQVDQNAAVKAARKFPGLKGMDLAKVVSAKRRYQWNEGSVWPESGRAPIRANQRLHVVAYDFGIKRNILRLLADGGCRMTVVPAQTSAEEALALNPDGIFLSNGPGDPEPCDYAIKATRQFLETDLPVFGICLGHQILGLAAGARSVKMKFGHHGANHPVQDLESGRVFITSQNHGFAVDEASLPEAVRATHRSLFDGSLQGLAFNDRAAFGFQGHPEASPGPHDLKPLFERFNHLMLRRLQAQLRLAEENLRRQPATAR